MIMPRKDDKFGTKKVNVQLSNSYYTLVKILDIQQSIQQMLNLHRKISVMSVIASIFS